MCFCGLVPWLYQYWPDGFMLFVVLCPGTPEGSTGSDSGFKASQKTGQWLKVSSDRLGEAGNQTCNPWFTRLIGKIYMSVRVSYIKVRVIFQHYSNPILLLRTFLRNPSICYGPYKYCSNLCDPSIERNTILTCLSECAS